MDALEGFPFDLMIVIADAEMIGGKFFGASVERVGDFFQASAVAPS